MVSDNWPAGFPQGDVGGIECITIDDQLWFFGFSYSNDVVLTPLIDDAEAMAAYAGQHMLQKDGAHEPGYWRELVEAAIEESDLSGDGTPCAFTTADFRRIASDLSAAEAGNRPLPGFIVEYDLLYLLWVAVGDVPLPDEPAYLAAMKMLGLPEDASPLNGASVAAEVLAQSRPLPNGATFADAAALLRLCLAALVNRAPGNWRTLFQGLIGR
jgi:hypothetical protein